MGNPRCDDGFARVPVEVQEGRHGVPLRRAPQGENPTTGSHLQLPGRGTTGGGGIPGEGTSPVSQYCGAVGKRRCARAASNRPRGVSWLRSGSWSIEETGHTSGSDFSRHRFAEREGQREPLLWLFVDAHTSCMCDCHPFLVSQLRGRRSLTEARRLVPPLMDPHRNHGDAPDLSRLSRGSPTASREKATNVKTISALGARGFVATSCAREERFTSVGATASRPGLLPRAEGERRRVAPRRTRAVRRNRHDGGGWLCPGPETQAGPPPTLGKALR